MQTFDFLLQGFSVATTPQNLLIGFISTSIGLVMGMLPALKPINGVGILLPVAYALGLPFESALILLAGVYLGCEYGGRVTAILINPPSSDLPSKTHSFLSFSTFGSFVGSNIAIILAIIFAPTAIKWLTSFKSAEYFALMFFILSSLVGFSKNNAVKTGFAVIFGLFLSTVGVSLITGFYHSAFGVIHLADSVQFSIVAIGFFSVSEILILLEKIHTGQKTPSSNRKIKLLNLKEFALSLSTVIFSLISVLGALAIYNVTPSQKFFNQQPLVFWGLIASLVIGNLILLALNLSLTKIFIKLSTIPNNILLPVLVYILVPIITVVSFIGVYAVHSANFDLILVILLGFLGFFLRKINIPLSPIVLGFLLGGLMKRNLKLALSISQGDLKILWHSPISISFWVLAGLVLLLPFYRYLRKQLEGRIFSYDR